MTHGEMGGGCGCGHGGCGRKSVMERLRDETAEHHAAAETRRLQKSLVKGEIGRDLYGAWLGQMLLVHRALESGLRGLAAREPRAARALRDEQMQEPYLLDDLSALGVDAGSIEASPSVRAFEARVEALGATDALALLGMHYVLEGSNNGNKYIARALMGPLGLRPGPGGGMRYLDPYGERQRAVWQQFKDDMNASAWTVEEQDLLVGAAREMFDLVGRLSDEVMEVAPAA